MRRALSRARVWLAIPLLAGGLFAFQTQAFGLNGQHHHHGPQSQSQVERHSQNNNDQGENDNDQGENDVENHSTVESHSQTCNTNEDAHENVHAQQHEVEHGCD